jgi:hypothetical protein
MEMECLGRTRGLTIVAILYSTLGVAAEPEGSYRYEGLKAQFTISLPEGWHVYKQSEAVTGRPSSMGLVIFSKEPVTKPNETVADAALLWKVDTGEVSSFFVDRIPPTDTGMSCDNFSITAAYRVGIGLTKDPMFGAVRQWFGRATPLDHKRIQLGGCQGFRYEGRGKNNESILDVRAVSDGKVIYLFMLRNRAEHYSKNVETFDKALETVRFPKPE